MQSNDVIRLISQYKTQNNLLLQQLESEEPIYYLYSIDNQVNHIFFLEQDTKTNLKNIKELQIIKNNNIERNLIYNHDSNKYLIKANLIVENQIDIVESIVFQDPFHDIKITIKPDEQTGTIREIKINDVVVEIENGCIVKPYKKMILQMVFNNILLTKFQTSSINIGDIFLTNALLIANCENLNDFKFLFSKKKKIQFANSKNIFPFEQTDYCMIAENMVGNHYLTYMNCNHKLLTFNSVGVSNNVRPDFQELNHKAIQNNNICYLYSIASSLVLIELKNKNVNLLEYDKDLLALLVLNKLNKLFLPVIIKSLNQNLDNVFLNNNDTKALLQLYYNLRAFNVNTYSLHFGDVKLNTLINQYEQLNPSHYKSITGSATIDQNISLYRKLMPITTILEGQQNILKLKDLPKLNNQENDFTYLPRTILIKDQQDQNRVVLIIEAFNNKMTNNKKVYFLEYEDLDNIENKNINQNLKNLIIEERKNFYKYFELNNKILKEQEQLQQLQENYINSQKKSQTDQIPLIRDISKELNTLFPTIGDKYQELNNKITQEKEQLEELKKHFYILQFLQLSSLIYIHLQEQEKIIEQKEEETVEQKEIKKQKEEELNKIKLEIKKREEEIKILQKKEEEQTFLIETLSKEFDTLFSENTNKR